MDKPKRPKKGLSDKELIEKYEIKKSVKFDRGLRNMLNKPSTASVEKKDKAEQK